MTNAFADIALVHWFAALGGPGGAAPSEEVEIQRLVESARRGDRGAARDLYRQHVGPTFRAVRSLVRDESEAEDVVQEAFVSALASLHRYRPQPGARFASWLAAIALNVARRRARWWRRVAPDPAQAGLDLEPSADPSPDEALDHAQRRAALLKALGELPTREREIVSLRYGAELTAAEVGSALGLGEANVRKICERQRRHLLERLGELLGDDEHSPEAESTP
ncbi:MAG: sigma-70 family RNA polymerase sigma factor [Deltaproteobacteria bacterium]|nr:sigma-70 family RNA polymerase sigma factor [Deltaproteobacteria bacterium]